jgi:alkanesulfonate monooxygenase SsuD/methylene tetrahydromethanopterin reductase-like flavin-dependent oxidoreductase (luciferase family)
MKLGLSLGYSGAALDIPVELVQCAEALGYDSVWTAEAYGSDAVTPLAYLAGKTQHVKLGTAIMQLAGRTPANAAMSAATVDALAGGGRFIAAIGVSGPQIVEGWYGQPWGKPYWRIKTTWRSCAKSSRARPPSCTRAVRSACPMRGPAPWASANP